MPKTETAKRDNGFTVYPDTDTLAEIDKLAEIEERKRSPMTLILIKRGLEATKKAKAKANA